MNIETGTSEKLCPQLAVERAPHEDNPLWLMREVPTLLYNCPTSYSSVVSHTAGPALAKQPYSFPQEEWRAMNDIFHCASLIFLEDGVALLLASWSLRSQALLSLKVKNEIWCRYIDFSIMAAIDSLRTQSQEYDSRWALLTSKLDLLPSSFVLSVTLYCVVRPLHCSCWGCKHSRLLRNSLQACCHDLDHFNLNNMIESWLAWLWTV